MDEVASWLLVKCKVSGNCMAFFRSQLYLDYIVGYFTKCQMRATCKQDLLHFPIYFTLQCRHSDTLHGYEINIKLRKDV